MNADPYKKTAKKYDIFVEPLTMEKTKIVGGGNLGVYLLCAE